MHVQSQDLKFLHHLLIKCNWIFIQVLINKAQVVTLNMHNLNTGWMEVRVLTSSPKSYLEAGVPIKERILEVWLVEVLLPVIKGK